MDLMCKPHWWNLHLRRERDSQKCLLQLDRRCPSLRLEVPMLCPLDLGRNVAATSIVRMRAREIALEEGMLRVTAADSGILRRCAHHLPDHEAGEQVRDLLPALWTMLLKGPRPVLTFHIRRYPKVLPAAVWITYQSTAMKTRVLVSTPIATPLKAATTSWIAAERSSKAFDLLIVKLNAVEDAEAGLGNEEERRLSDLEATDMSPAVQAPADALVVAILQVAGTRTFQLEVIVLCDGDNGIYQILMAFKGGGD